MVHKMHLCKKPFDMIAKGEKTIELRLYDEKRRLINVGDTILFTSLDDSSKILKTEVINIYVFKKFAELYNTLPLCLCGYREGEEANSNDMLKYYSKSMEEKYGVVGIKIKVINNI